MGDAKREEGRRRREEGVYLGGGSYQSSPIDPRQNIVYQRRVRLDCVGYQLAVLGVEGEGSAAGFAGFDGAGEEVEG